MAELDGPRWGPASKATPKQLVVLCHGLGADGHDLIDLAPTWSHALPDALFVSVDAPFPHESGFGRQWWSVEDRTPAVMEAGVRRAAGFLDAFIDAELARLGLPADAFALMGFSQGAMTALFTGLRRASRRALSWRSPARWSHPRAWPRNSPIARQCCWCTGRRTMWCRCSARATPRWRCVPQTCLWRRCMCRGSATGSMTPDWRWAHLRCSGRLPAGEAPGRAGVSASSQSDDLRDIRSCG